MIHIMRGLPASGKSTKANELMKDNQYKDKQCIYRLNKSTLRKMLWPLNSWTPDFEKDIQDIEVHIVKFLLKKKYDVIIDSTNLKPRDITKWRKVSKNIKIHDFRKEDIAICIMRDIRREQNGCGPQIIIKLARENGLLK